jgi:hypothetical protein
MRNHMNLSRLTVKQILAWADAYRERTGQWPKPNTAPQDIPAAPGETWRNVHQALQKGLRGLPAGSSLPQLLRKHRGVRNVHGLPRLTTHQILAWARAYHAKNGQWPTCRCLPQPIEGTLGETWFNVDQALRKGLRGLAGGSSLAILLARRLGKSKTALHRHRQQHSRSR